MAQITHRRSARVSQSDQPTYLMEHTEERVHLSCSLNPEIFALTSTTAQKIKNDLIQKAKVKKAYAKIKAHEDETEQSTYDPYAGVEAEEVPESAAADAGTKSVSQELHPDRKAMLETDEPEAVVEREPRRRQQRNRGRGRQTDGEDVNGFRAVEGARGRDRKPKPSRFKKEFAQAEERRSQFEDRQHAREERDKDRRAMAKARKPGKDGKMKLGKQGTVLLNRVKRMTEEGKI